MGKGIKKKIKQFLINQEKSGNALGKAYRNAIDKKRAARFEQFADIPTNDKLVVFESFMGRKYTDSPKAIYEYMLASEKFSDFSFVWCFRDSSIESYRYIGSNERTTIVRWGSADYYKTYATAKYWVVNTRIPKAIERKEDQVYVQCWHGTPLKKLGLDITTEVTESRETTAAVIHDDVRRYSYLLSPSRYFTEKMSSALDLDNLGKTDIVVEEGYPRNDAIANAGEADVKRIRANLGIPAGKKVILYAPTYRENQRESQGDYYYREPLDFEQLRKSLGDDYVVLFRAHYYIASQFDFAAYEGFIWDVSEYPEVNDLYIAADMLITDYSSVFFDYSILNRPEIFYMYDLEFYRDELRGFYLTLEDIPGPIVESQDELEKKILSADKWFNTDDSRNTFKSFRDRFVYMDDGKATERVVARIIKQESIYLE